jgi:hypothetical protein
MTSEMLSMYAGVLVSLLFSYLPGLSKWYEALSTEYKKLIMAGSLLVVAIGVVAIACLGYGSLFDLDVVCDKSGIAQVVKAFMLALVGSQATYLITKK